MWFFNFIPGTLLYLMFFTSIISWGISLLLPKFLLQKQIKLASITMFVISIYLLGMFKVNEHWKAITKDLQQQVLIAEAKSFKVNKIIQQKTIVKTEIIKQKGENIVQYVDREVVKYNNSCVIPQEFITAHNRATEVSK